VYLSERGTISRMTLDGNDETEGFKRWVFVGGRSLLDGICVNKHTDMVYVTDTGTNEIHRVESGKS
jgi:sugar lactone lactonase YvrE